MGRPARPRVGRLSRMVTAGLDRWSPSRFYRDTELGLQVYLAHSEFPNPAHPDLLTRKKMDHPEKELLKEAKTIAVVGLSANPDRPSYRVSRYLQQQGYKIIPVNPNIKEVLGEKAYPSLKDIPDKVDIVDVFRRSEDIPPIADEAIAIKAKVLWMQEGIVNEPAAKKAEAAGLKVVMDHCIMVSHSQSFGR